MRKLSWRFKSRKIMSCVLLFLLLGTLQAMAQQKITGVVKMYRAKRSPEQM